MRQVWISREFHRSATYQEIQQGQAGLATCRLLLSTRSSCAAAEDSREISPALPPGSREATVNIGIRLPDC